MDLISKINARQKKRELERLKKLQAEEIFKKPQQAYTPSSHKLLIVAAILFVTTIAYIIYDSEVVVKNGCGIMPGILCTDLSLTPGQISFNVHNYLKEDFNITLTLEGCEGKQTQYIRPNNKATYTFNCTSTEKVVRKNILITYAGYSGLSHDTTGALVGKLQQ